MTRIIIQSASLMSSSTAWPWSKTVNTPAQSLARASVIFVMLSRRFMRIHTNDVLAADPQTGDIAFSSGWSGDALANARQAGQKNLGNIWNPPLLRALYGSRRLPI